MWLTKDEARFVDDLRQAAKQCRCVADLVLTISQSIVIHNGEQYFNGDATHARMLEVASVAAGFVYLDVELAEGSGDSEAAV